MTKNIENPYPSRPDWRQKIVQYGTLCMFAATMAWIVFWAICALHCMLQ